MAGKVRGGRKDFSEAVSGQICRHEGSGGVEVDTRLRRTFCLYGSVWDEDVSRWTHLGRKVRDGLGSGGWTREAGGKEAAPRDPPKGSGSH